MTRDARDDEEKATRDSATTFVPLFNDILNFDLSQNVSYL